MKTSSELPGFYRLSIVDRHRRLQQRFKLEDTAFEGLGPSGGLTLEDADGMVENVIGTLALPVGVCLNLRVNGEDRVVPMAIEEPSVIAAASRSAKLFRAGAGLAAETTEPLMEGQVQLVGVADPARAEREIRRCGRALLELANARHRRLTAAGGGARAISTRRLQPAGPDDPLPEMMIAELLVDVRDAMGANAVNSMCEEIAPELERLSGGRARLRILSNLSRHRRVMVRGRVPLRDLSRDGEAAGADLARGVVEASVFAERDPMRAATHNKGIMNGVDAVLLAFGQDWRAVEAGAHAYAARDGRYGPLSRWRIEDGELVGTMSLPLAVGVVGGTARAHPTVNSALHLARVADAADLARLAAAVGLAQNLGALRALAAEGIQDGHLRMHARHVLRQAGAEGAEVERVARDLAARRTVSFEAAREALQRRGAGGRDRAADEDAAYCASILRRVSRSFALSIEGLPLGLREGVRTAYLLCRIVDTVEDQPPQEASARQSLFGEFEHQLLEDEAAPEDFERACALLTGAPGADADVELCRGAGAVLRTFRRLPEVQREVIRHRVFSMSQGMRRFCARLDRDGFFWVEDMPELERYCYYVAGTVGELLTGLFEEFVGEMDPETRRAVWERAVPFGLGLQMVNILKDVGSDLERGVCYLPRRHAHARGVPLERLLAESHRDRALGVVAEVSRRARTHLGRARDYTLLWPGERSVPVRLFCAVPLALALATLGEIERGEDTLRPGQTPKVSRRVTAAIVERAHAAAADPGALEAMLDDYAFPRRFGRPAPRGRRDPPLRR